MEAKERRGPLGGAPYSLPESKLLPACW